MWDVSGGHFYSLLMFSFAATIFAYGQTSSGKTFTMRGVAEYAVKDIFEYIHSVRLRMKTFTKSICSIFG